MKNLLFVLFLVVKALSADAMPLSHELYQKTLNADVQKIESAITEASNKNLLEVTINFDDQHVTQFEFFDIKKHLEERGYMAYDLSCLFCAKVYRIKITWGEK